jgi:hypothetical protein
MDANTSCFQTSGVAGLFYTCSGILRYKMAQILYIKVQCKQQQQQAALTLYETTEGFLAVKSKYLPLDIIFVCCSRWCIGTIRPRRFRFALVFRCTTTHYVRNITNATYIKL